MKTEDITRHYCRYQKCRSRLPAPVSNEREAFCSRGCHNAFYRKRCLVCEEPMERKTERQLVCGKRRCRNALRVGLSLGRYHTPSDVISPAKKPANTGLQEAVRTDRGVEWALAVNRARIRAPRLVIDTALGDVPTHQQPEPTLTAPGTQTLQ